MTSGNNSSGNGMTMDVCNAILLWYADVINDVRDDNNDNCAPAFDGGNIDVGLLTSTVVCGTLAGVSNDRGERAATPAVVGAAEAGREGGEAPAGGSKV